MKQLNDTIGTIYQVYMSLGSLKVLCMPYWVHQFDKGRFWYHE